MNIDFKMDVIKSWVASILDAPPGVTKWKLHGFGMLRHKVSDHLLVNIWLSDFMVPGVTKLHTHPWSFSSLVVCGSMRNDVYDKTPGGDPYMYQKIRPGIVASGECDTLGEPQGPVLLGRISSSVYTAGSMYGQPSNWIHSTVFDDGTVTVNLRKRTGEDEATLFWEADSKLVSARPRLATEEEIWQAIRAAKRML